MFVSQHEISHYCYLLSQLNKRSIRISIILCSVNLILMHLLGRWLCVCVCVRVLSMISYEKCLFCSFIRHRIDPVWLSFVLYFWKWRELNGGTNILRMANVLIYLIIYYLILCQNSTRWQTDTRTVLLLLYNFSVNCERTMFGNSNKNWFCNIGNNNNDWNGGKFWHIYILLAKKLTRKSGNTIKLNFHKDWYLLWWEFSVLGNSFHLHFCTDSLVRASRLQIALCVPSIQYYSFI